MPPKAKFTKERIAQAALQIVREQGMPALSARAISKALHCSVQPIFSCFANMEELQSQALHDACTFHRQYLEAAMAKSEYPAYKASGMAYIRFAKEEKHLFELLFMRPNGDQGDGLAQETAAVVDLLMRATGLSRSVAERFHSEMWIFVHGIAVLTATGYFDLEEARTSEMLTDVYEGLKARFLQQEDHNANHTAD